MNERNGINMQLANAFIPEDRRHALADGRSLPLRAEGAALFADISGFTPLTEALAQRLGPRRGAEVLTRQLNIVYSALIKVVEQWHGSVIGFSGDAITCWFDNSGSREGGPLAATGCALAMQHEMADFAHLTLPGAVQANLALKTAVVSGAVSRLQVGEPTIQYIDVLAGGALDALADAESSAHQGDIVVDSATLAALTEQKEMEAHVQEWRTSSAGRRLAVLAPGAVWLPTPASTPAIGKQLHQPLLDNAVSAHWVLPPVYARLSSEGVHFLAELRPATALFLQFGGLDFDADKQAGALLDAFVRWVQKVVDAQDGAVIQLTTGDKGSYLYAAFGAPISHDEDMQRAVAVALILRNPPPQLATIRDIRIGISQGLMRVGPYGGDTRLTYGVLGDATNLAARLMTQADVGQICVSAKVAEQVSAQFDVTPLGLRSFKGKAEAQLVYAVLGPRLQPLELEGMPATPLVGRDRELAQLLHQVEAIAKRQEVGSQETSEQGSVVQLIGEAGAGKSHLAAQLARLAAERGLRVIFAACQSTAQNRAFFAAQQFVRTLLALQPAVEGGSPDARQAQVRHLAAQLEILDPKWLLRLPLLGDLLGLPIADNPTTAAFDARLRQEALTTLVIDIVRRAAQECPLLLVIEDAHWLDEASRALVLALARSVAGAPILLLLVQRPLGPEHTELAAALADLPVQQQILLAELDADGTAQLVRQRLAKPIEGLGIALIHSLAQGNPFFSEELVDALCEGGLLIQEQDEWRLSPALIDALRRANCLERVGAGWQLAPNAPLAAIDLGVPASIHGLVLSRLDRLPEENKLTLKVASVIGRVFELDLLAAAHPGQPPASALAAQFPMLQTRDFARLETLKPRPVYVFKHNITQEVVYQTLLESQRQELHIAVAEALEERTPDDVERLAHHYVQADTTLAAVRTKALHYIDAAGWRARKEHANETALAYFDQALQMELRRSWLQGRVEVLHILGRRLHEEATLLALEALDTDNPQQQLETAMLRAQFHTATGDYQPAAQALRQAQAVALAQGDRHSQARCHNEQATIDWRQGNYAAAQHGYQTALTLAAGAGEQLDVESEARYGLGLVYRQQSRYDAARAQFEQALAAAEGLGDLQMEARVLNALGSVANLQRDFAAATELFTQALEIRETIGDRAGVGASLMSLAQAYGNMGDYSRVEPLLLQALEIQQAVRNRWEEMLVLNELGILYTAVGHYEHAYSHLAQAMERSREIGSEIGAAYILCNLGQAQRDAGRLEAAKATLAEGLLLAEAQGDVNLQAIYWSDAALTSLRAGEYMAAIEQAERSLALYAQLEQPLAATTGYAVQAASHLQLGRRPAAEAAVRRALAILDECGGEGPDFPQRDYWLCAQVLALLGDKEAAQHAVAQAVALLQQRAGRISDAAMRQTYLSQVATHAEIMQAG